MKIKYKLFNKIFKSHSLILKQLIIKIKQNVHYIKIETPKFVLFNYYVTKIFMYF
jgi:hypothetical protein